MPGPIFLGRQATKEPFFCDFYDADHWENAILTNFVGALGFSLGFLFRLTVPCVGGLTGGSLDLRARSFAIKCPPLEMNLVWHFPVSLKGPHRTSRIIIERWVCNVCARRSMGADSRTWFVSDGLGQAPRRWPGPPPPLPRSGARLYAPPESLAAQKLACLVDQLADAFRQGSLRLDALTATALTKVQGHLNQARYCTFT